MPIYDIVCDGCGRQSEVVSTGAEQALECPRCGSRDVRRIMSPTSALTGKSGQSMPGPGDTGCCGSSPGHAGCAGPGSCCGRNSHS